MLKSVLFAAAVFTGLAAPMSTTPTSAAQPLLFNYGNVNEAFIDFLLAGCMPASDGRTHVSDFAMQRALTQASQEISAAFLRGKAGAVYVHGGQSVIITSLESGACSVLARRAPDVVMLIDQVEAWLTGAGGPFIKTMTEETGTHESGKSTTHVYEADVDGHNIYAVMITTAREDVLAQAVITVAIN